MSINTINDTINDINVSVSDRALPVHVSGPVDDMLDGYISCLLFKCGLDDWPAYPTMVGRFTLGLIMERCRYVERGLRTGGKPYASLIDPDDCPNLYNIVNSDDRDLEDLDWFVLGWELCWLMFASGKDVGVDIIHLLPEAQASVADTPVHCAANEPAYEAPDFYLEIR